MSSWRGSSEKDHSSPEPEVVQRRDLPPQWATWRLAAQSVTRAWNEWSAAGNRDGAELYARYASAIAAEERAATALEHAVEPGAGS